MTKRFAQRCALPRSAYSHRSRPSTASVCVGGISSLPISKVSSSPERSFTAIRHPDTANLAPPAESRNQFMAWLKQVADGNGQYFHGSSNKGSLNSTPTLACLSAGDRKHLATPETKRLSLVATSTTYSSSIHTTMTRRSTKNLLPISPKTGKQRTKGK